MDNFNLFVKIFSMLNNAGFHWSPGRRSPFITFGIFFAFSQLKNKFSLSFFNKKKGNQYLNNSSGQFIGGLITIQGFFGIFTMFCFPIIVAAKSIFKEFYGLFLNHSNLNPLVILRINTIFSAMSFFNTNISFAINKPCQISNQFIFSHISLIPRMGG